MFNKPELIPGSSRYSKVGGEKVESTMAYPIILIPGVNLTKLCFSSFSDFALLSLSVCNLRKHVHLLNNGQDNSKKRKNYVLTKKKKFGKIGSREGLRSDFATGILSPGGNPIRKISLKKTRIVP